ncbi:MAG: hypothetical protein NTZ38_00560 [Candidatus Taylorbacteria bacterium]|nr:hypothetical protein [Candidatus Taylorbacteria bacterium]
MTLFELIKEYKNQVIICSRINYTDKQSVDVNNTAVERMYGIVDTINSEFGRDGLREFAMLLDIKDYNTNVWSAVHLLENMKHDHELEEKALEIIKEAAKNKDVKGLGYRHWLKTYASKKT